MPTRKTQLVIARACIADAERPENSLETQTDAAVLAVIYLDESARQDPLIADYLARKYEAPIAQVDLVGYHVYALALAKRLLSKEEHK